MISDPGNRQLFRNLKFRTRCPTNNDSNVLSCYEAATASNFPLKQSLANSQQHMNTESIWRFPGITQFGGSEKVDFEKQTFSGFVMKV